MIRFERTKDRRVGNLWIGQSYVGAIDHGVMKIVPHLAPWLDKIKEHLPARFRSYEPVIGWPAERDWPWPQKDNGMEKARAALLAEAEALNDGMVSEVVKKVLTPDPAKKRGRGRPPGSKNAKKKAVIQKPEPTESNE